MKKLLTLIAVVAALALITQWAVIRYVPNIVHAIAVKRAGKINEWINSGKTDASMRRVVLPNPDFVYSALFYDVNEREITITGVLPDRNYASVAFYDSRCQPYYVYNNLDPKRTGAFTFHLGKHESAGPDRLKVKTNTGVIICRYLIKRDDSYVAMKSLQSKLICTVN